MAVVAKVDHLLEIRPVSVLEVADRPFVSVVQQLI